MKKGIVSERVPCISSDVIMTKGLLLCTNRPLENLFPTTKPICSLETVSMLTWMEMV